MSAYMIARVRVTDPQRYKAYVEASTPLAARFGGRFVARGGKVHTLEGPDEGRRLVVIEFPDAEKAKAWFASEEYQAARKLRLGAAEAEFLVVEGV